ncbi:hypothetical protein PINS_up006391 [Pythium insidiosum]|nr:hypothetical protein PINS_up006391 [Pythium insidiosum]
MTEIDRHPVAASRIILWRCLSWDINWAPDPHDDSSVVALHPLSSIMALPTTLAPLRHMDSIYAAPLRASTAVRVPGRALRLIDRIEINHVVIREGVTFYVLEIYDDRSARQPKCSVGPIRRQADAIEHTVIDVSTATPTYAIEKRFSEFEALRNKLVVCFENLHPGPCSYCDAFLDFLAQSSTQPGLLVKMTTRATQRKTILGNFINEVVRLGIGDDSGGSEERAGCDGWSLIPSIIETFIRERPQ